MKPGRVRAAERAPPPGVELRTVDATIRRLRRALNAGGEPDRPLQHENEHALADADAADGRVLLQLGEAALVELTAVVAFANFTTRPNVALGIESDGFAAACGLKPLAQPTAVGSST